MPSFSCHRLLLCHESLTVRFVGGTAHRVYRVGWMGGRAGRYDCVRSEGVNASSLQSQILDAPA